LLRFLDFSLLIGGKEEIFRGLSFWNGNGRDYGSYGNMLEFRGFYYEFYMVNQNDGNR
jgi:hypothetical protein